MPGLAERTRARRRRLLRVLRDQDPPSALPLRLSQGGLPHVRKQLPRGGPALPIAPEAQPDLDPEAQQQRDQRDDAQYEGEAVCFLFLDICHFVSMYQTFQIPKCSSKIFSPIRIKMIPPRRSAPAL